jgi:catalase (peroxidase I)
VLENAVAQIIAIIDSASNRGDALGGIVRLAFHDAGSWDGSSGGADGCVDLVAAENAGLEAVVAQLAPVVSSVNGAFSRADVWALAGNVAVEVSGGPAMEFEIGRTDAENCQGHGSRLPNAELDQAHVRDVFLTRYGLTERETAALMGAHVLGRAESSLSGYNGAWVPRNDRFSNDWFGDLLARPWRKRSFLSGDSTLTQWDGPGGTMMLNTDVEMAFDTGSPTCDRAGGPIGRGSCPRATHAFSSAVTEFAAGLDAWHTAFAPAFKKLTSLGAGSLVCALADCSTPGPNLCGGGGGRRRPGGRR